MPYFFIKCKFLIFLFRSFSSTRPALSIKNRGRTLSYCGLIHHVLDREVVGSNLAIPKNLFQHFKGEEGESRSDIVSLPIMSFVRREGRIGRRGLPNTLTLCLILIMLNERVA